MNDKNLLSALNSLLVGNRTYLTIVIAFIALGGQWAKVWTLPPEMYAALFAVALGFIRAGVKNDVAALTFRSTSDDAAPAASPFSGPAGPSSQPRPASNSGGLTTPLLVMAAALFAVAAWALFACTGCVTSKVTTVTPGSTNAAGIVIAPVTNTVTIVNTNNLNIELSAASAIGTPALTFAVDEWPAIMPILQDTSVGLSAIVNGTSTNTPSQVLALAGSKNSTLNAQLLPVITFFEGIEAKYLLPLAESNAYGNVSVRIAQTLLTIVDTAIVAVPTK